MSNNNYRDQILARLDKQDEKGLRKYGMVLEQNHADIIARLDYLAEKLVDGLRYVEWAKDYFSEPRFTFPRTKFVDMNTLKEQVEHIKSELDEFVAAFEEGEWEKADLEACDLIHSVETFMRIRQEQGGVNIDNVRRDIVVKNLERNYYTKVGE